MADILEKLMAEGGVPFLSPGIHAPEKQVLRYTCKPKLYAIPPNAQPFECEDNGVRIFERHEPQPKDEPPPHIGNYTITMEAAVSTSDAFQEVSSAIRSVAEDLDRFWIYACGEPLEPIVVQISFDTTPSGWQSNEKEVKQYFLRHAKEMFPVVKLGNHRHTIAMPYYPLLPAIEARKACRTAGPLINTLVDLHYNALKFREGHAALFTLAKGLELAVRLLPGRTRQEKHELLPAEAKSLLTQPIKWLFEIANTRLDVRHVVQQTPQQTALHPRITGEEATAFKRNADVLLRYIICSRLGITCPNLQKGEHK